MKHIFGILFFIFCVANVFSQDEITTNTDSTIHIAGATEESVTVLPPHQQIDSATKHYVQGFYRQSLQEYESVLAQGYESAELYFNAGNAAFKINELALAIWYYEKSLKLDPNDEDALYNLGLVNSRIPDKIEVVPEMFLIRWMKDVRKIFSADQWAIGTVIFFVVALLLLGFYFLSRNMVLRKVGFWVGLVMLFLSVVAFFSARIETNHLLQNDSAIVFSPSVTIKSSPTEGSTDIFVLHEGAKVYVLESVDDWYKIKIANGSVGWLPTKNVRLI
ncbi:MAG: tetratricopeptide repeat protein [Bacteroidales bacterium]|nr:tetratricopeptide repeat protein [Bacteroidales bacterium]